MKYYLVHKVGKQWKSKRGKELTRTECKLVLHLYGITWEQAEKIFKSSKKVYCSDQFDVIAEKEE